MCSFLKKIVDCNQTDAVNSKIVYFRFRNVHKDGYLKNICTFNTDKFDIIFYSIDL